MGDQLTKDQLEILWQGAAKFARQCANDYHMTVKEYGRKSTVAISAWKRFMKAEKERMEAEKAWQAAN